MTKFTPSENTVERPLPADINAERAVIASILIERDAIRAVEGFLTPDHFHLQRHAYIYKAALDCARRNTPPDLSTVADALRRAGHLEDIGGIAYLGELCAELPTAVHVEYYAKIVHRTAVHRQIIQTGGLISAMGYDERNELEDLLGIIKEKVEMLDEKLLHPKGITAAQLLKMNLKPVKWYVPGLLSQGFGYLAAKPGTGKTWLMLQWAVALASGGKIFGEIDVEPTTVLFLALEDTAASLKERVKMICDKEPPHNLIIFTEEDGWKGLDEGGLNQLEGAIRYYNPGVIFVDTLTSIAPDPPRGSNPYKGDYQSYLPIRALADAYKIAIIGSWHFNKSGRVDIMEMTSGSMGLPAVSINRIGIVREQDQAQARLKAHSKRGAEADWMLNFDATTCQWTRLGDTEKVKMSETRRTILEHLEENGTSSIKDILEMTGIPYNTLVQNLKRMKDDGVITSPGKGCYTIPEQTHEKNGKVDIFHDSHDSTVMNYCHEKHGLTKGKNRLHDSHDSHDSILQSEKQENRCHAVMTDSACDTKASKQDNFHDRGGVMTESDCHELCQ
jgi:predicted transcriptional regulator